MEDPNRDLLGVSVSPEGLAHLKRLASTTKWTLFLCVVVYFAYLVNNILQRLTIGDIERFHRSNPPFYYTLKLNWGYLLVLTVLNVYEFSLLIRFCRQSIRACEVADSRQFNESLGMLTRVNRIALATMLVAMTFGVLEIWASIIFYSARLQ